VDPVGWSWLTYISLSLGDATVFVEVGEAGIAVDHAMRRELAVQAYFAWGCLEKISRPPRDYRPERAVPIEAGLVKVAKDARRRRTEAIAGAVVRPCVFVLSHYQKRATSDVIVDKFARAAEYTNVQ
jgi:hypothetical protein